jgi:hypothetical protein
MVTLFTLNIERKVTDNIKEECPPLSKCDNLVYNAYDIVNFIIHAYALLEFIDVFA